MLQNLDDEEKGRNNVPTLGGNQEMWTLTEDGIYYDVRLVDTIDNLERLSRSHEIVSQSTNKYSIITICNFDRWQDVTLSTNQQLDENLTNDFIQNQQAK